MEKDIPKKLLRLELCFGSPSPKIPEPRDALCFGSPRPKMPDEDPRGDECPWCLPLLLDLRCSCSRLLLWWWCEPCSETPSNQPILELGVEGKLESLSLSWDENFDGELI
jgi:hypothetical protein